MAGQGRESHGVVDDAGRRRGPNGIGEWGFAAVLEADGRRILIDTGARPETVLKNVAEMKIDLSDITESCSRTITPITPAGCSRCGARS